MVAALLLLLLPCYCLSTSTRPNQGVLSIDWRMLLRHLFIAMKMTRHLSIEPPHVTLPDFGIFQKRLGEMLKDPGRFGLTTINPADLKGMEHLPVARLAHIDMASSSELNRAMRRTIIGWFAQRPNDTGSPEVQIALDTLRMALLERHLTAHRHDHRTRRTLDRVVAVRKRMLKYLRRLSLERFYTMLDRLGLPHGYIEQMEPVYAFKYAKRREFKEPANRTIRGGGRFAKMTI